MREGFAPFAFGDPPSKDDVPLLFDHNAAAPAGKIDDLYYDAKGNLMVRCTATHDKAKRCNAFSVGARVREFEICNADSLNFYALVKRAVLTDVSLVPRPANPKALVKSRERVPPSVEFWDFMQRRVAIVAQMTELLRKELHR